MQTKFESDLGTRQDERKGLYPLQLRSPRIPLHASSEMNNTMKEGNEIFRHRLEQIL